MAETDFEKLSVDVAAQEMLKKAAGGRRGDDL